MLYIKLITLPFIAVLISAVLAAPLSARDADRPHTEVVSAVLDNGDTISATLTYLASSDVIGSAYITYTGKANATSDANTNPDPGTKSDLPAPEGSTGHERRSVTDDVNCGKPGTTVPGNWLDWWSLYYNIHWQNTTYYLGAGKQCVMLTWKSASSMLCSYIEGELVTVTSRQWADWYWEVGNACYFDGKNQGGFGIDWEVLASVGVGGT